MRGRSPPRSRVARRGPSMREQTPPRSRVPRRSPSRDLGVGEISASFKAAFGGRKLRLNHPAGRDAFTRQPLRGGGRVADGVRRRQLALAIMPHSGRDRRLVSLHPSLCCYSRRGVGLWSPVRTCLTPPATVSPTPCTFPLRRTFRGHRQRPSNAVRLLTGARFGRQHPRRLTSSNVGFCALLQPSPCR